MLSHIPHLDVGSGRSVGGLTLFPVWSDAPTLSRIRWSFEHLEVGELSGGASVGRLEVGNPSGRPTALIEGDLLEGGQQHRMSARTVVLEPFDRATVDVVCVEAGRWGGDREHRALGGRGAPSVRRGALDEQGSAQSEVWRRISRYDERYGRSETSSMLEHLRRDEAPDIRRMPGQRGVIVGIGGRVLGLELFGSSRGLASRWDGLVRAAWLDARSAPSVPTPSRQARKLMRSLGALPLGLGEAQGSYRAVRFDGGPLRVSGIAGAQSTALAPIHLTAFDDAHPLLEAA
jgi:hypothetical protein